MKIKKILSDKYFVAKAYIAAIIICWPIMGIVNFAVDKIKKEKIYMKKSGIKVLALFLSMALCLSLGGCGKEKTTSEKDGSNVGLIDFDDQTGSGFSSTDNSSGSGQTSNATISGSGETIKNRVEFDSKNPFSNIPKRLRGTTVKFAVWGDEGNDKYKPLLTAFTRETGI